MKKFEWRNLFHKIFCFLSRKHSSYYTKNLYASEVHGNVIMFKCSCGKTFKFDRIYTSYMFDPMADIYNGKKPISSAFRIKKEEAKNVAN